jgi:Zn-dependent peptidase ImmA (M78 family)
VSNTRREGSKKAIAARQRLGLADTERIEDLLAVVEEAAGVHVVVALLPEGGPDGIFTRERGEPFILVNSRPALVRQRFTLAHEFGHHELGHGDVVDERVNFGDQRPKEVAANAFAAEFLAPRPATEAWFAREGDPEPTLEILVMIAHHFRVSPQMMRYRLEDARKLRSRRQQDDLDRQIAGGEHLRIRHHLPLWIQPDSLARVPSEGIRVPLEMTANVLQAHLDGVIDVDRAAKRLRTTPSELQQELDQVEREVEDQPAEAEPIAGPTRS